jgi:2,4-dienoyl-CoA reductase-like NADH-dependent reductase (Old Yellow Enzyme family)
VVTRIRAAVGEDFIIGIRMSGDDLYPGPQGMDIEKSKKLAQAFESTGTDHCATLVDVWSGEESTLDNIDTVVMATGYLPNNSIYRELSGRIEELYGVGDCTVRRRVPKAIHTAYLAAFYISGITII